jgi:hypothetical protein
MAIKTLDDLITAPKPSEGIAPKPKLPRRRVWWLALAFVVIFGMGGSFGFLFGKQSPCSKMESFDIRELGE